MTSDAQRNANKKQDKQRAGWKTLASVRIPPDKYARVNWLFQQFPNKYSAIVAAIQFIRQHEQEWETFKRTYTNQDI